MTPRPLLEPSMMLGLLLLACLALPSSGQASTPDTQAMTDQCSATCSNRSACDGNVFCKKTCCLTSCFNVSNCTEDLLTEDVPGTPTELQPNSSSFGLPLDSGGSALNNATGVSSPRSSLNQTSPERESSDGPSSSAGGALPHLNSSSDSSASPQPAAPIQLQDPVNHVSASTTPDSSQQPAPQSPVMPPPAEPQAVTGTGPMGTNMAAPAGPAMTSASTSSPIAAARTATTTTQTTAKATSMMSVERIAPLTSAPPAATAVTTSTTSTAPKAKAPVITTPKPTITTATKTVAIPNTTATTTVAIPTTTVTTVAIPTTTATTTVAIPTTTVTTTVAIPTTTATTTVAIPTTGTSATTTTSTATEAPPDTERKPSTQGPPERLSPTANPKVPPAPTSGAGSKMEDAATPRGRVIEVAGAPLAKQLVDTASLWAVMLFGLLFFLITVALFVKQAYESYRRKDYTQVDYLINGMYTDSGV